MLVKLILLYGDVEIMKKLLSSILVVLSLAVNLNAADANDHKKDAVAEVKKHTVFFEEYKAVSKAFADYINAICENWDQLAYNGESVKNFASSFLARVLSGECVFGLCNESVLVRDHDQIRDAVELPHGTSDICSDEVGALLDSLGVLNESVYQHFSLGKKESNFAWCLRRVRFQKNSAQKLSRLRNDFAEYFAGLRKVIKAYERNERGFNVLIAAINEFYSQWLDGKVRNVLLTANEMEEILSVELFEALDNLFRLKATDVEEGAFFESDDSSSSDESDHSGNEDDGGEVIVVSSGDEGDDGDDIEKSPLPTTINVKEEPKQQDGDSSSSDAPAGDAGDGEDGELDGTQQAGDELDSSSESGDFGSSDGAKFSSDESNHSGDEEELEASDLKKDDVSV